MWDEEGSLTDDMQEAAYSHNKRTTLLSSVAYAGLHFLFHSLCDDTPLYYACVEDGRTFSFSFNLTTTKRKLVY